MKPKDKILTYQQARELKWFGDNCLGLRQEYYGLLGQVTKFGEKLERLSKQGLLIEEFLRTQPKPGENIDERIDELANGTRRDGIPIPFEDKK